MPAGRLIDSALIRLFRFNTRGILRMARSDGAVPPAPAGDCHLYVHVPFCAALCPFCSFHRVQHSHGLAVRYFAALRREIALYHAAGYRFTGAYFGGGTPTIEPGWLLATIARVRELFPVRGISVETNPRDLQPRLLADLRAAGVTRLSVGVQSLDDRLLRDMGRLERYGAGDEILGHLRRAAGLFETLNVDLIFNQPRQDLKSFIRDLELVRLSGANQISCYPLMTPPAPRGRLAGPMGGPDRLRLPRFHRAMTRVLSPDFRAVSAWCFTSRGGAGDEYIVEADNYAGLGSGAFGYLDGTLHATTFSIEDYVARVTAGRTGITACHTLGETERMRYALLVKLFGLRLDEDWVRTRFGPAFYRRLWGELLTLRLLGAVKPEGRGWRLTGRGRYWLMLMMSEFFESVNACRDTMRRRTAADQPLIVA